LEGLTLANNDQGINGQEGDTPEYVKKCSRRYSRSWPGHEPGGFQADMVQSSGGIQEVLDELGWAVSRSWPNTGSKQAELFPPVWRSSTV